MLFGFHCIRPLTVLFCFALLGFNFSFVLFCFYSFFVVSTKLVPWFVVFLHFYFYKGSERSRVLWLSANVITFHCGERKNGADGRLPHANVLSLQCLWNSFVLWFANLRRLKFVLYNYCNVHSCMQRNLQHKNNYYRRYIVAFISKQLDMEFYSFIYEESIHSKTYENEKFWEKWKSVKIRDEWNKFYFRVYFWKYGERCVVKQSEWVFGVVKMCTLVRV